MSEGVDELGGPRPLLPRYLLFYAETERIRHPSAGVDATRASQRTQIFFRWDERLALDVEYVENCSFRLDVDILARPVLKVLRGSDVVAAPQYRSG